MPRVSRNTKQKEIILEEVQKMKDFFTAEDLYGIVKKRHSNIGMATVYRFLKELRKNKRIHAYTCNNRLLYNKEKKSHCHFICEETGKVIHFDVDSLDFLKNKIPGSISSFQIEVRGKCKECSKAL
jgi:Fur family ferric uptake transcriptional regulator